MDEKRQTTASKGSLTENSVSSASHSRTPGSLSIATASMERLPSKPATSNHSRR